jgi:cytochrome c biogenesis protein CcmG, thiol:disulfide interchange protein DsbE
VANSQAPVRMRNRPVVGPFTVRHLALLGATLIIAAVVLLLLNVPIAAPGAAAVPTPGTAFFQITDATAGLQVGQKAPELTGVTDGKTVALTDLDGKPLRLADMVGHPVWLSFFATWCPPCQQEMPVLRDEYAAHSADGLDLVGISVQETTPADVKAYAQTYGLTFPIGFDGTSAVFHTYHGYGLPTHVFLDRDGTVRQIHLGPLTNAEAEQILAPLLAQ